MNENFFFFSLQIDFEECLSTAKETGLLQKLIVN